MSKEIIANILPAESTKQQELDKLIADIEDETDSSSIDKVLAYAEELQNIDDEFMQLLSEKLGNTEIYWEQPEYQQIHALTRKNLYLEDNEDGAFRTDTINKQEHDVIAKNWRKLRKKYGLPDNIISLTRWKNTTQTRNPKYSAVERARRFATAYLARGLKRNLHQVYRHILSYYGGQRKGLYNDTERKIIDICCLHMPKTAGTLSAAVLGRDPRGIYKRLYKVTNGIPERGEKQRKGIKWNLTLATKFIQSLLTHTGLELEQLKNRQIEREIWLRIAEEMDHNEDLLQHFWYCYLHVQLFVKADVKLQEVRTLILEKLRKKAKEKEYQIWSDIRWKDVALEFPDAYTPRFLYRVCTRLISDSGKYKGHLGAPIEDVIDYAFLKIKNYRKLGRNKRLKTLKLNQEGQLEIAYYRSRKNILDDFT